jgi:hypothetical protein
MKTYSVLNIPLQVIFAICPAMFRYLTNNGWLLFGILLGLSVVHYRFFHIFFVLVVLELELPSEKDKSFWRSVGIFTLVIFLWGYLQYLRTLNWVYLP